MKELRQELRQELIDFYRYLEGSDYLYHDECEMHVDDYLRNKDVCMLCYHPKDSVDTCNRPDCDNSQK